MGGEVWKTISRAHNKGNSNLYESIDNGIFTEFFGKE